MTAQEQAARSQALACEYAIRRFGKSLAELGPTAYWNEAHNWAEHIVEHACCIDDAYLWLAGDPLLDVEPCVRELMLEADRLATL